MKLLKVGYDELELLFVSNAHVVEARKIDILILVHSSNVNLQLCVLSLINQK